MSSLLQRIQLSIDGFARNEHVSTWVNTELLKEAKAEIERLTAELQDQKDIAIHNLNERDRLQATLQGLYLTRRKESK